MWLNKKRCCDSFVYDVLVKKERESNRVIKSGAQNNKEW